MLDGTTFGNSDEYWEECCINAYTHILCICADFGENFKEK